MFTYPPLPVSLFVAWYIALLPSSTASSISISYLQNVSNTPYAQVIPEPTLNIFPLILLPSVSMQYRLGPFQSTPASISPICSPQLLQQLMRFTIILDEAATEGYFPFFNSYMRTCYESQASQYMQSAAPPAMVANFRSLILITLRTFSHTIQLPMVALESTAIMIPCLKTKARVVVPVWKSIILLYLLWDPLICWQNSQGFSMGYQASQWSNSSTMGWFSLANGV